MLEYIIPVLFIPVSYGFGCLSSARLVAKTAKSLNIQKVGTGLADTENIYTNVGKVLGMLVGMIDVLKMYLYLQILQTVFSSLSQHFGIRDFSAHPYLLLYGALALIGHTLPVSNHFRGGRGILTYCGLMLFLAPYPALIASALSLFFFFSFKQMRFAQYTIVLAPALLALLANRFFGTGYPGFVSFFGLILLMSVLNIILSRRRGEI